MDAAGQNITFRVYSSTATRIEVWVYDQPLGAQERLNLPLSADPATKIWAVTIPVSTLHSSGVTDAVYYGYRAWGPNWTFDPSWTKGSGAGFQQDVDAQGNRFNPNKLLLDPYALEVSHDPLIPTSPGQQTDGRIYQSGAADRNTDTGSVAPKGIVIAPAASDTGSKPVRAFKDEIIYEVNLRGSETILHQSPDAFSQTAYRPTQFFLAVGRQQSVDNPAHCGFATSAEWTLNTWLHFRAAHCPSLDQTRSRGKSAPKSASPSSHVRIGDRLRQT